MCLCKQALGYFVCNINNTIADPGMAYKSNRDIIKSCRWREREGEILRERGRGEGGKEGRERERGGGGRKEEKWEGKKCSYFD